MIDYTVYCTDKSDGTMKEFILQCLSLYTSADYSNSHFIHRQNGKPYLGGYLSPYFNASDSGCYRVCAIGYADVGCDIQIHSLKNRKNDIEHLQKIGKRYFSSDESSMISTVCDFYNIWSAKESYVKLTGEGIDSHFGDFSIFDSNIGIIKKLDFEDGYSLYLSSYSDFEYRIVRI